jgi:hypothetical protein
VRLGGELRVSDAQDALALAFQLRLALRVVVA